MKPCAKCRSPRKCLTTGKCAAKTPARKAPAKKKPPYGPKKSTSSTAKKSASSQKQLKNACWKGYEAIGTKQKNGRTVPNCVPKQKAKTKKK